MKKSSNSWWIKRYPRGTSSNDTLQWQFKIGNHCCITSSDNKEGIKPAIPMPKGKAKAKGKTKAKAKAKAEAKGKGKGGGKDKGKDASSN